MCLSIGCFILIYLNVKLIGLVEIGANKIYNIYIYIFNYIKDLDFW